MVWRAAVVDKDVEGVSAGHGDVLWDGSLWLVELLASGQGGSVQPSVKTLFRPQPTRKMSILCPGTGALGGRPHLALTRGCAPQGEILLRHNGSETPCALETRDLGKVYIYIYPMMKDYRELARQRLSEAWRTRRRGADDDAFEFEDEESCASEELLGGRRCCACTSVGGRMRCVTDGRLFRPARLKGERVVRALWKPVVDSAEC
jgi:hypothetical protein